MSKSNKHLGSRLSLTSDHLKKAALQVNSGDPIEDIGQEKDGNPMEPHLPDTLTTQEEDVNQSIVLSNDQSLNALLLISISGQLDRISPREWQSLNTFISGQYSLQGKIGSDVVKLTADNHEFLKRIKFVYDLDMSLFVNTMLELFRRRFLNELPKLPVKISDQDGKTK